MGAEMGVGPDVEHHGHHSTGHRWLDVTLGVSAVFISLMSVLLALQHGRAMERMVQANTWPFVMVEHDTAYADGSPHFSMWITNNGVGPAKVGSIEVFYGETATQNTGSLIRTMLKISDPNRKIKRTTSDVIGTVLPAREKLFLFELLPGQLAPEESERLRDGFASVHSRVCYCSVFDECWVLDERSPTLRPEPVKACPVPKVMFKE